ncbi:hypothetical protein HDU96_003307 [Phlyctochytrium bullatum]|nr:hypothetical protein HDU96_003307 [Phlyctochytrium bullatum]
MSLFRRRRSSTGGGATLSSPPVVAATYGPDKTKMNDIMGVLYGHHFGLDQGHPRRPEWEREERHQRPQRLREVPPAVEDELPVYSAK